MPEETPQETQVQAPVETLQGRPATTEPLWHMLFDRLDAQDENIKRAVGNTVVIASEQERLRMHVNDEQQKFVMLLAMKVNKADIAKDILELIRHSHMAQLALLAIVGAMAPVVIANWTELVTSVRGVF